MGEKVNVKNTTLSSFENGRSTNYNHLIKYYACGNDEQKVFFREHLPLEVTMNEKYFKKEVG